MEAVETDEAEDVERVVDDLDGMGVYLHFQCCWH